jgi:hypothetical protein
MRNKSSNFFEISYHNKILAPCNILFSSGLTHVIFLKKSFSKGKNE